MTAWDEYRALDFKEFSKLMRKPSWVFDTRSCINHLKAREAGFNVWSVGSSQDVSN